MSEKLLRECREVCRDVRECVEDCLMFPRNYIPLDILYEVVCEE